MAYLFVIGQTRHGSNVCFLFVLLLVDLFCSEFVFVVVPHLCFLIDIAKKLNKPPTAKTLRGHNALGLSVRPFVCSCTQMST